MLGLTPVGAPRPRDRIHFRQPRSALTRLAALLVGLPDGLDEAAAAVNLTPAQFMPMPDGAWQANLAVPSGIWRLWPERGIAAWFGARTDRPLDQPPARLEPARLDLIEALRRLHRRGHWPGELSLLGPDGWTRAQVGYDALRQLAAAPDTWTALAGTWSDGVGGALYVEFDVHGRVWAHSRADAKHFLLLVAGLSDD
jgi:hypothetical protein